MAETQRSVLALDIGGTKLATAVVTPDGRTHGSVVAPTSKERGPDDVIARLFALGQRSIEAATAEGLAGSPAAVGISCGGPLDATTGILTGPLHLPGWVDVPIVDLATQRFGVPAVLENDATAGALGEFRYGASRGAQTALYLTVSTGIGGGAVVDGRLHRGAAGNGGEFGHIMVMPGGRACLCGRSGCLEAYASGTSIAERARDALAATDEPSSLRDVPVVRAEHVSAEALAGDRVARRIWDETVDLMATALTDLTNILEPDSIVLGGGVTRSGDLLLHPLREAVHRDAMPPAARAVTIDLAHLGDEVCVIGAAALAFDLLTEAAHV